MNYITTITTGTLIACIFWGGISILTMGSSLTEANINFLMLPEILSVGIFCGLITELADNNKSNINLSSNQSNDDDDEDSFN